MTTRAVVSAVLFLATLSSIGQSPADFDEAQFERIAGKPHSDQELARGLQIYPRARAYKANVTATMADGARNNFEATATEKAVDGKYIVTAIQVGEGMTITMIVTWDAKADLYYKYVAVPNGPMLKFIGLRAGESRALAWTQFGQPEDARRQVLVTEVHSDQKSTWREVHLLDGKAERVQHGEATVTKR